jgi:hypothetical protein
VTYNTIRVDHGAHDGQRVVEADCFGVTARVYDGATNTCLINACRLCKLLNFAFSRHCLISANENACWSFKKCEAVRRSASRPSPA